MQQTLPPTTDRVPHAEPITAPVTGPRHPAFEAWFAGSRIIHDGAPLVCYHGTAADFSVFKAHQPVTVYRLNGEAITRIDSWDVDGDWSRRPEGFHYGALVDAQTMGAEAALRFRMREAASLSPRAPDPSDDTERRLTDLRRIVGGTFTHTIETQATGDGHYFTPDQSYSFVRDIGRHDAGRVMAVYLSIRNPIYLNAAQIETAGMADRVAHYRTLGHDGAIFADYPDDLTRRGWNGASQIVAFDAHQIKSVWNVGTFDPGNPDIRFRRDEAAALATPPTLAAPRAPNPFTFPGASPFGAGVRARLPASAVARDVPPAPAIAPALAEEAARAQRAAAFQAWFADSAIRHADGRPRVLYHGTATDFTAFRPSRGTPSDPGWYGSGIYLTADAELASAYAGDIGNPIDADAARTDHGPRVIAAYAALQNPYHWPQGRCAATTVAEAQAIRAELEAAGYDGVVVGNAYADPEVAPHWEVVAFHPAQVKSVYNVGTFDPTVADMRYARSPDPLEVAKAPGADRHVAGTLRTQTEGFRRWFGASRVVQDGQPQMVYHGSGAEISAFDLARAGDHSARLGDVAFFTSSPRVASGYAVHLDQNAELVALTEETRLLREQWAEVRALHGADTAAYRAAETAYWTVADRRSTLAAAIHRFEAPITGANVLAAFLALDNPLEVDAGGQLSRKDGLMARAIAQAHVEGRDGVIVRNVLDHATPATRELSDVFVV